MKKIRNSEIALVSIFVLLGVLTRTVFHVAPNVEFVTALSLAAGYFFKNSKYAWLVPFSIMLVSDFLIGNDMIFLFTWSGFLAAPLIGKILKKKGGESFANTILTGEVGGLASVLIFFLWTNFGVVVLTNMYPRTLDGLFLSYVNALPFLSNQILGNLVIVPMVFGLTKLVMDNKKIFLSALEGNIFS